MSSLLEKDSSSSSLWLSLFARRSKLLCLSWLKAFHTLFYCIFQSNLQNTWHPNDHTIFVEFPWVLALFRGLEYQELHLRTVPWRAGSRQLTQNNMQCSFAVEVCCLPVREDMGYEGMLFSFKMALTRPINSHRKRKTLRQHLSIIYAFYRRPSVIEKKTFVSQPPLLLFNVEIHVRFVDTVTCLQNWKGERGSKWGIKKLNWRLRNSHIERPKHRLFLESVSTAFAHMHDCRIPTRAEEK